MDFFFGLMWLVLLALVVFVLVLPFMLYNLFRSIDGLRTRLKSLERRHDELATAWQGAAPPPKSDQAAATAASPAERAQSVAAASPAPETTVATAEPVPATPAESPAAPLSEQAMPSEAPETPPQPAGWQAAPQASSSPAPSLLDPVKAWLLGGNTLARVGVLVLFFGVAFLLKYSMEQGILPIELRLAGAALGGFALLALGWRLRALRRGYALVLLGGGVGVVYLTAFSAVALYDLLPAGLGLLLMVGLVALSAALAVLLDARSLAVLGSVGGFLAPVLMSQGGGSHVVLFAYYLVLAGGILGIAWFKAWRELNLVGFGFIFVIGGLWGYQHYQPAHFASAQPFLIAFFLLYVLVPVLFALRQPPRLKGYVDGSLVFGVPLLAFALQAALVADFEYGLAFSALAAGLFYAGLAGLLLKRGNPHLRLLIESFLALAVAFGTLAIPFALEGRYVGAAWALEGAALVWIGVRQRRMLARIAGLAIQLAAGVAHQVAWQAPAADWPLLNSVFIGALLVSLAALFSAYYLQRHREVLSAHETDAQISGLALAWGLLWWLEAGVGEIREFVPAGDVSSALLVYFALSAAALAWLRRRLDWSALRVPVILLLPILALIAVVLFAQGLAHPFARWGLPAWLLGFAVFYGALRTLEGEWPAHLVEGTHLGGFWLLLFLLSWEAAWLFGWAVPESPAWSYAAWGLVPAVATLAVLMHGRRLVWPLGQRHDFYVLAGLGLVAGWLLLWTAHATFQSGDPRPLPYVPVLNPVELGQAFALMAMLLWCLRAPLGKHAAERWYALAGVAFLAFNGVIARGVHHWAEVPFSFPALWAAERYQASVSIAWTLGALAITLAATRWGRREVWLVGAALIGAVVAKLFLVDLAGAGTLARIVSFIGVGVLILVIAYLSPLPPRVARAAA